MHRRTYLGVCVAAALAGCSGGEDPTAVTTSTTDRTTQTSETTRSTTAESTRTSTQTTTTGTTTATTTTTTRTPHTTIAADVPEKPTPPLPEPPSGRLLPPGDVSVEELRSPDQATVSERVTVRLTVENVSNEPGVWYDQLLATAPDVDEWLSPWDPIERPLEPYKPIRFQRTTPAIAVAGEWTFWLRRIGVAWTVDVQPSDG